MRTVKLHSTGIVLDAEKNSQLICPMSLNRANEDVRFVCNNHCAWYGEKRGKDPDSGVEAVTCTLVFCGEKCIGKKVSG